MATYREVVNVPSVPGTDELIPQPWAKDVVDYGIAHDYINTADTHRDDWLEIVGSGRYWTFEYRQDTARRIDNLESDVVALAATSMSQLKVNALALEAHNALLEAVKVNDARLGAVESKLLALEELIAKLATPDVTHDATRVYLTEIYNQAETPVEVITAVQLAELAGGGASSLHSHTGGDNPDRVVISTSATFTESLVEITATATATHTATPVVGKQHVVIRDGAAITPTLASGTAGDFKRNGVTADTFVLETDNTVISYYWNGTVFLVTGVSGIVT